MFMEIDRIMSLEHRVAALEAENQRLRIIELAQAHARIDELLQQLGRMAESLDRQVRHDGLTGLSNNRDLDTRLEREFARVRRFKRELSLAMIDIDGFAAINDRYSRGIGDQVLQTAAQIIRQHCRSIDVVARYAADTFVVLLIETSEVGAARVCENFRASVEDFDWGIVHDDLEVTVSIGFAPHQVATGSETLLAAVGTRLDAARHAGGNRVVG
jgi:diguanylate cyclase (GGDEF)-like protein